MLELRNDKGTDYILSWKYNAVYNSKLKPLYTTFLHSIKLSGNKMEIKSDRYPVVVEQNNCLTRNVILPIFWLLGQKFRFKFCIKKLIFCSN